MTGACATRVLAAAAALLMLVGCGSSSAKLDPEAQAVHHLVASLADRARNPKRMAEVFSGSTKPDAALCKRFEKYMFVPEGEPTFSDGQATVKIKIYDGATSQEVAAVDWILVKEGKRWKLKDAPLP